MHRRREGVRPALWCRQLAVDPVPGPLISHNQFDNAARLRLRLRPVPGEPTKEKAMTQKLVPEDYGYRFDMTMEELHVLFSTLNIGQVAALSSHLEALGAAHIHMNSHPAVEETFSAPEELNAEIQKSKLAIDKWLLHMPRTKANRMAMEILLNSRRINEKLMKRLCAAEMDATNARHQAKTAMLEAEDWQITALALSDRDSHSIQ
jgi:hypothetical protein